MIHKTSDLRISRITPIDSPEKIFLEIPASEPAALIVEKTRHAIHQILNFKDDRILAIIGPCSIHDPVAAIKYAEKLLALSNKLSKELLIVMRVYFEKPRTRTGWKGLINDPNLDSSFDINKGIRISRKLLLDLNNMGLAAGTEFLDIVTGQYTSDLISWGAIGARTTESQIHREMASGLSCPVGFKNGTDGNLIIACDAMYASAQAHIFLSPTRSGETGIFTTKGNPDTHVILRGGKTPNYDAKHVQLAIETLKLNSLPPRVMIDLSHANCEKQFKKQIEVGKNVANQISDGNPNIIGLMLESFLQEGSQKMTNMETMTFGQSITDACLCFEDTKHLLNEIASAVKNRRKISTNI